MSIFAVLILIASYKVLEPTKTITKPIKTSSVIFWKKIMMEFFLETIFAILELRQLFSWTEVIEKTKFWNFNIRRL